MHSLCMHRFRPLAYYCRARRNQCVVRGLLWGKTMFLIQYLKESGAHIPLCVAAVSCLLVVCMEALATVVHLHTEGKD